MANYDRFGRRFRSSNAGSKRSTAQQLLCLLVVLSLTGCQPFQPEEIVVLDVRVRIAGKPVQDVRVTLKPEQDSETGFKLVGVTDHAGMAAMRLPPGAQLPAASEFQFRAALESLGDWMIREPWSDTERTPLQLSWNGTQSPLEIELPRKAVRSL